VGDIGGGLPSPSKYREIRGPSMRNITDVRAREECLSSDEVEKDVDPRTESARPVAVTWS
jgi:hypothetical protein